MDMAAVVLCIVVWFPVHVGLWGHEVRRIRKASGLLRIYGVFATALGIALGLCWYPKEFILFGDPSRWHVGLLPGAGMLLIFVTLLRLTPRKQFQRFDTMVNLGHFLVVVGLFEEVWFRGIWFAVFNGSFLYSVVVGSIVFGLIHYNPLIRPKDIQSVVLSMSAGSVFAAARYAGAGIIPLGVAHGALDFIFHYVCTDKAPRYAPRATGPLFIVGCIILVLVAVVQGQ